MARRNAGSIRVRILCSRLSTPYGNTVNLAGHALRRSSLSPGEGFGEEQLDERLVGDVAGGCERSELIQQRRRKPDGHHLRRRHLRERETEVGEGERPFRIDDRRGIAIIVVLDLPEPLLPLTIALHPCFSARAACASFTMRSAMCGGTSS